MEDNNEKYENNNASNKANNDINNEKSKKVNEITILSDDEDEYNDEIISKSGKIDKSRSKKKKIQTNNRKNDRKNKMDRNECGYGEEV